MNEAETLAIANAIDSISEDFPDVPRSRVTDLVRAEHLRFDGKPIRDFVPVLVESRVREQLRSSTRRSLQAIG